MKINRKNFQKSKFEKIVKAWQLYVLMIPALLWAIVFAYYPMYGLIIAFKNYKIRKGIIGSPWAEPLFKYFEQFFSTSIACNSKYNCNKFGKPHICISDPDYICSSLKSGRAEKI